MTLDLTLLSVMLLFALLGAISGASRQIAQLLALVAAYAFARPLGLWVAPGLARAVQIPLSFGAVLATVGVGALLFVGFRALLVRVLQRLLRGEDLNDAGLDRALGFVVGGLKVAGLAWMVLSALTFVEAHVRVVGKRLGVSPQDSLAFTLARNFNLFELTQFSAAKDLLELAQAKSNAAKLRRLRESAAFQTLRNNPQFRQALEDGALHRAVESRDPRAMLESEAILRVLGDPTLSARIQEAARALEEQPAPPSAVTGQAPPP